MKISRWRREMKLEWPMLTSTEPCDELRPMVTERFFMRYSNSRPSSRATAAAAAAAILASEGAGRPPLRPSARTGPAAAAAARHRQGRGRRSTQPDAVHRRLMDGGAGPMRGPHAHGAMAARPMASGAEASAAQHVRLSGPENTGKARKTRSRAARGGAERPSCPRRREKGCAGPRQSGGEEGRAARSCPLSPAGLAGLPSSSPHRLAPAGPGRRRGSGHLRERPGGCRPLPLAPPGGGRRHPPQPTDTCFSPGGECHRGERGELLRIK